MGALQPLAGECGEDGCPRKKALRVVGRREVVTHLVTVHGLPVQRGCRVMGWNQATYDRSLVDWVARDAR